MADVIGGNGTNVENDHQERSSIIERHAQTIIVAILLALLLWTGATLLAIRDDVTTMKIQVQVLQNELRNAGDDRFRGADWRREREIIEARFNRIEMLLERHTEAVRNNGGHK